MKLKEEQRCSKPLGAPIQLPKTINHIIKGYVKTIKQISQPIKEYYCHHIGLWDQIEKSIHEDRR